MLWAMNDSGGVVLTTYPDDVPAWKNDRFGNVHDGTSQNQWSKVAKPRAMPESTGICSGVYPVMSWAYSS